MILRLFYTRYDIKIILKAQSFREWNSQHPRFCDEFCPNKPHHLRWSDAMGGYGWTNKTHSLYQITYLYTLP